MADRGEQKKAWANANPEKVRASWMKWSRNNPEKRKAIHSKYAKIWYQKNREKVILKSSIWHKNNKAKSRQIISNWMKANPGKVAAKTAKRRATKLKATPPWLTKNQLKQMDLLYIEAHRMTLETGIKYSVDHIWPLQGVGFVGLHVPWNLRIMTLSENSRKHNRMPDKVLKCP